jgi:hypothetical protein
VPPKSSKRANPDRARLRTAKELNDEWIGVLRSFYQTRRRQKVAGWILLSLAAFLAISHFLAHVNVPNLTPFLSLGTQDVLVGYPAAGVLLIIGVVLLGQSDEPPRRGTNQ